MEYNIESLGDLIISLSPLRTPTFTRFSYFMTELTEQEKKDIKYNQAMAHGISRKEIQASAVFMGKGT